MGIFSRKKKKGHDDENPAPAYVPPNRSMGPTTGSARPSMESERANPSEQQHREEESSSNAFSFMSASVERPSTAPEPLKETASSEGSSLFAFMNEATTGALSEQDKAEKHVEDSKSKAAPVENFKAPDISSLFQAPASALSTEKSVVAPVAGPTKKGKKKRQNPAFKRPGYAAKEDETGDAREDNEEPVKQDSHVSVAAVAKPVPVTQQVPDPSKSVSFNKPEEPALSQQGSQSGINRPYRRRKSSVVKPTKDELDFEGLDMLDDEDFDHEETNEAAAEPISQAVASSVAADEPEVEDEKKKEEANTLLSASSAPQETVSSFSFIGSSADTLEQPPQPSFELPAMRQPKQEKEQESTELTSNESLSFSEKARLSVASLTPLVKSLEEKMLEVEDQRYSELGRQQTLREELSKAAAEQERVEKSIVRPCRSSLICRLLYHSCLYV